MVIYLSSPCRSGSTYTCGKKSWDPSWQTIPKYTYECPLERGKILAHKVEIRKCCGEWFHVNHVRINICGKKQPFGPDQTNG